MYCLIGEFIASTKNAGNVNNSLCIYHYLSKPNIHPCAADHISLVIEIIASRQLVALFSCVWLKQESPWGAHSYSDMFQIYLLCML